MNLIKVLSCENRRHPLLLSEVLRLIDINQVCHILLKFDDELYLQNGKLWYIHLLKFKSNNLFKKLIRRKIQLLNFYRKWCIIMLSKVNSIALRGLEGYLIEVQVDISSGMPCWEIVGLPDISVKEAKERVKTAIKNSGHEFLSRKNYSQFISCGFKKRRHIL